MSKNTNDDCDQVTLYLDDNSELLCDILAIYPCGDKQYIALVPAGSKEDSDVFLYRFEGDPEDEDSMKLIDIESDEEFEEASDAFDEYLDDLEFGDFIDEEDE